MALSFYLNIKFRYSCCLETHFYLLWESYCLYTEESIRAVFLPILHPNFYTFGRGGRDTADRTPPPHENSACRGRHIVCRACYTRVCRFLLKRTSMQDATFCSGSSVASLRNGLVRGVPLCALLFCPLQPFPDGGLFFATVLHLCGYLGVG